jgi:hypothetical protein
MGLFTICKISERGILPFACFGAPLAKEPGEWFDHIVEGRCLDQSLLRKGFWNQNFLRWQNQYLGLLGRTRQSHNLLRRCLKHNVLGWTAFNCWYFIFMNRAGIFNDIIQQISAVIKFGSLEK